MEDQLISFETAKLAKEIRFEEKVRNYFKIGVISKGLIEEECTSSDINFQFQERPLWARPTQTHLQRWLREKHRTDVTVITEWKEGERFYRVGLSYVSQENKIEIWFSREEDGRLKNHESYEVALEEGLKEGLKLIPEKVK